MRIKKIFLGLFVSLILVMAILVIAHRPLRAEDSSISSEISQKLDNIAKDEKDILEQLGAVKEELRIIKIRITQTQ